MLVGEFSKLEDIFLSADLLEVISKTKAGKDNETLSQVGGF